MVAYLDKCPACRAVFSPSFERGLFYCPECTKKKARENHDKKKFDELCKKLKRDLKNDRLNNNIRNND